MRLRALVCSLLVSVHVWAAEAPASAPPDQEAKLAQAKARYEEGVEAYAAGRFKDAVDLFLDADRMSPSAPLSFNIARAYEKLGDDSGSLRWYRDYLRRSPDAPNAKAVEELVLRYEARLAKKGVQQLTVQSTPTGATVAVDQKPVGVTPWTGDLVPGAHRVDFTMRGYSDASRDIQLAPDRAQDLSVELVEAPVPAESAAPAPTVVVVTRDSPSKPQSDQPKSFGVWPWVTLGAGGAALGAGLAFELMRRSSENAAEQEETQVGYKEELDRMESRRTTARVLVGVGGALVAVGGTMLIIDLNRGKKSKSKPTTALVWSALPDAVDVRLSGSF